MPFIGNQPALAYTSFAKQDFTTSATTSYTLDNPVTNANELALFINFVRQEPTTAYSASGTSLTLTSATSATDDMYCVFLGKAVQTVNPPNASVGLSQLTATGTKNSTTFLRGDNTFASAGGTNSSMFSAKSTANQTGLSSGGWTKIQFDTATFNVGSNYDTTNDKFVAPSDGKYFFTASLKINSTGGSATLTGSGCRFSINGSTAGDNVNFIGNGAMTAMSATNSMILNLTATQYVEVYAYYQDNGGGTGSVTGSGDKSTQFYGYKLIT